MSTTDGTGHCSEHGFQPSQLSDSNYIQANKLSTQPPDGQLPEVSHVDLADAVSQEQAVGEIIESIKLSGACIVRNMVSTKALDEIERDIRPHLDTASVWKGDFYPEESRRVTGCVSKSKAFALNIVGHPVWHAVGSYFLTSRLKWNWIGRKNEQSISAPQLSNTVVFSIQPGARKQALHRDDDTHHNQQTASATHALGRDTGMTVFVAATKSTRANGATRFIPGSHLWDYSVPPPDEAEPDSTKDNNDDNREEHPHGLHHAELNPGDAFMMLSGVYHAAGANTTRDQERLIYSAAMVRGWLRQEENQYLANDIERLRELPVELRRFAGWSLSRPSLGWVDFGDPIGFLGGRGEEGVEDMF